MNNLPSNTTEIKETDNLFCYMLENQVFYTYYKPNTENTIKEVEFVFSEYQRITQGTPARVLIEMGVYSSFDDDSRKYLVKHKVPGICEAVVTRNLAQRLIINFYFRIKSHSHPSKAFKTRKDALKWVNSFN